MPKRTDIKKILIIGAGPIVIGQACEFDYSGAQACKSLKEEGYEIILINSSISFIFCIILQWPFKARNTKTTCSLRDFFSCF